MKKSILVLVGILVFVCGSAFAQDDAPMAEVFGGFSVLNVGDDLLGERESFYGFQANAGFNLNDTFGIVADFGGQYKDIEGTNIHIYEYLFGPRFNMRGENTNVFVHALFGGVTAGAEGESENAFAMGFGGGFDINVSEHFAVRPIQFDWIMTNFMDDWQNDHVRLGFGIVIK